MIIVATIPTAIIGLLFNDLFESFYTNLVAIGCGLLITGTLLFMAQRVKRSDKHVMEMNYRNAIFVGVMQGIAITPGISRSGSTLFGGLLTQLDREFAVKFAFLISIPSILGSFLLELPDAIAMGTQGVAFGPVIVGMLVAAVSGYAAIKAMIRAVVANKLTIFSGYTWALGAFVVIYGLFIA
jgi:undecaprenyl-diphosphatase